MSLNGEVDKDAIPYHWHWTLFPALDLFGPEVVYMVGLEALEYPPTWVDQKEEVEAVEAALVRYLEKKGIGR